MWAYTTVLHQNRKYMDLSVIEYCYLDLIYKTQSNPNNRDKGWSNAGLRKMAEFLGLSTGGIHKLHNRLLERGFLEGCETKTTRKRTTEKWYLNAYKEDVRKVNTDEKDRSQSEQECSQSERKCSQSERHLKDNSKVKPKEEEITRAKTSLGERIGFKQEELINKTPEAKNLLPEKKKWLALWLQHKFQNQSQIKSHLAFVMLVELFQKHNSAQCQKAVKLAIGKDAKSIDWAFEELNKKENNEEQPKYQSWSRKNGVA